MKRRIRKKGKISLKRYFQNFEAGERASVIREPSVRASFPERIQGKTGIIEGRRGGAYILKVMDNNQEKRYIIEAIHLKKIGS
jgi:large subunit ribosomal protein L21e